MRETQELEPMLQPFTFEADDRMFACQIEQGRTRLAQPWWWFTVSGESHRFAPFQPVAEDTVESVRSRVLSYYRELVARRALSLDHREAWELRRKNLAALKSVRRE
jgi:hypothetical protein